FTMPLSAALLLLLIALGAESKAANGRGAPTDSGQEPQQTQPQDKAEKRRARRARKAEGAKDAKPDQPNTEPGRDSKFAGETVEIVADKQQKNGDLWIYEGYVVVTLDDMKLQADHATYNSATGDVVTEGNVIFDQGPDQR